MTLLFLCNGVYCKLTGHNIIFISPVNIDEMSSELNSHECDLTVRAKILQGLSHNDIYRSNYASGARLCQKTIIFREVQKVN